MAQPDNPKLYNALEQQARSKYPSSRTKGLTYAAAKWLSSEYAKNGGSYVDSIKELDTSSITEEDLYPHLAENSLRKDEIGSSLLRDEISKIAPRYENGFVVVPRVIET